MADNTKIEWADATLNYVNGCSVLSPGCTNCYAMRLAGTRLKHHPSRAGLTQDSKAGPVWTGEVRAHEPALLQALKWKRPRRIFWNAHGDLFHENVPDEWIDRLFAVCALTPQHTHMILTKRSARMREYFAHDEGFGRWGFIEHWAKKIVRKSGSVGLNQSINGKTLANYGGRNLPNVMLGVSVEDQARADQRIPDLLATPAAVRFISAEPLLSALDLSEWLYDGSGKSLSGAGGPWPIQHRRARPNMAPRSLDGRRGPVSTVCLEGEGGAQFSAGGQLFEGNVRGRAYSAEGVSTPHRLDGVEPTPYPAADGDQSHQWSQAGQPASESRIGDAPAERAALSLNARPAEEGPSRREEYLGQIDRRESDRDSGARGGQVNDAARNDLDVRSFPTNDIGHRSAQNVEAHPGLDWVIAGGESGPRARPMQNEWAQSLVDQCGAAGVACFVKQLSSGGTKAIKDIEQFPEGLRVREFPQ